MAVLSQIVTLVGVVIGALASYLATAGAERARYHRMMATRWDERKLNAYTDYAMCVKDISAVAKRAAQASDATTREDFLDIMEKAELRRSSLFETLVLLASPAAVTAANEVNLALWDQEIAARDGSAAAGERDLVARLNAYHAAARQDLGINLRTVGGEVDLPASGSLQGRTARS